MTDAAGRALGYFERVFVINLPARADRRAQMARELRRVGLDLEREPVELFPAVRPGAPAGFASVGARGCFLSHLAILDRAARAEYQRVLILEDDVDFAADFAKRIDGVVAQLASSRWGLFYGGGFVERVPAGEGPLRQVPPATAIGASHFVAFQGAAIGEAARFLGAMLERPAGDPRGGPMHVDGAYNWYRRAHAARPTLIAVPELGRQRRSRTDVHELRWFDRLPLVREAVANVRRVRNRVLLR